MDLKVRAIIVEGRVEVPRVTWALGLYTADIARSDVVLKSGARSTFVRDLHTHTHTPWIMIIRAHVCEA